MVITLGGLSGSLGALVPPADFLLAHGYGVVEIAGRQCASPPGKVTLGYLEGQDAVSVIQYIMRNDNYNAKNIGVYGFSMGGAAAVRAARLYPEIDAVVAEGAFGNLGENFIAGSPFKALEYNIAIQYWLRTGINPWRFSPIDDLAEIKNAAVFLIYGEHEPGSAHAPALYQAANQPKQLWIVPGGSHGVNHLTAPQVYEEKVLDFFDRYLLDEE